MKTDLNEELIEGYQDWPKGRWYQGKCSTTLKFNISLKRVMLEYCSHARAETQMNFSSPHTIQNFW